MAGTTAALGSAERLGQRTWAYLQLPGGWFLNNAGIVAGSDGSATLVDTCATNRRTGHLLATARRLVGDPGACVSTHHHGDHTYGHHLLPREVPIWAAAPAREEAAVTGLERYEGVLTQPDWGTQELRLASHVVPDEGARLDGVAAFCCPGTAHTRGDVVTWVADDGVLFTGDLVFHGVAPLAVSGSVSGWLEALEWLRRFDAGVVVPGHGPVCREPARAFDDMERYLTRIFDGARAAVRRGKDPVTAAADADLGSFEGWEDATERAILNVHVAMAELTGQSFDLATAAVAALQACGGPFPCRA